MFKSFKSQDDAENWLKENFYVMSKDLSYKTKELQTFNLGNLIDRNIAD